MREWTRLSPKETIARIADTILAVQGTVRFSELPHRPGLDAPQALLDETARRMQKENLDVLYVDLTPSQEFLRGAPARAVKAIVPGLEVETMTYARIGPRNLRRLRERIAEGDPLVPENLVGRGAPPDGAERVLLTAEDEAARSTPCIANPTSTPSPSQRKAPRPLPDAGLDFCLGPVRAHRRCAPAPAFRHLPSAPPMPLRFAYNTNGAANHRLDDALALIAEAGYDGVALTLDHHHLDPLAPRLAERAERLSNRLRELSLDLVVETGARFLLDPRQKHEPTLLHPDPKDRARRLDFLTRALDVCAAAGGETISFWAGVPQDGVDHEEAWRWLIDGAQQIVEAAAARGVDASFEPEPGHLVATTDAFRRLQKDVPGLKLALDTGHCLVTQEIDPAEAVRAFAADLGTVAIEDMQRGVHHHLFFGEGDMDVPGVLQALEAVGFDRLVCVELSRASPTAHETIPAALDFLKDAEAS